MRAISLWQPWASAMALGLKKIETRSWNVRARTCERIAIHAAARRNHRDETQALLDIAEFLEERGGDRATLQPLFDLDALPRGAVIGVGRFHGCAQTEQRGFIERLSPLEHSLGNYAPGRYAWMFDRVDRLPKPVPMRGKQGLWIIGDDAVRDVLRQLVAA